MTTRDEIAARARKVVADQLQRPPEDITEAATFMDLGADSLDRIDCTFALEEEFDLEIEDQDADELASFGHVVDYLARRLGVGVPA